MEKKGVFSDEKNDSGRIPNQRELEKELSDYLTKKYGNRVKVISPFVVPKKDEAMTHGQSGEEAGGVPHFDMMPEELESYLDSFVVKQDQVKAVLATKICTHFNRVKFNNQRDLENRAGQRKKTGVGMIKNNVLMIGPPVWVRPISSS